MDNISDFSKVFREFFEKYPDEIRHPLVVESKDWEVITPVLVALGESQEYAIVVGNIALLNALGGITRCIMEAIYTMGYERGKIEEPVQSFIVAEGS